MCVEPLLVYRRRPAQTLRHTHAHIGYRCGSCPLEPRKWTLSARSSSATLEPLFRLLQSTSQFAPTWLARANGTGPPRFREWVNHRCSVSLFNKVVPCPPCPSLCVGGGGVLCVAYSAHLGRLGGSRLGLGSLNKIPCQQDCNSALLPDLPVTCT